MKINSDYMDNRITILEGKELDKDIELAWEEWRGTSDGRICTEQGFYTIVAFHFLKFYLNRRKGHEKMFR